MPHIGHCSTDSGERVLRKTFADMVEVTGMTFISELVLIKRQGKREIGLCAPHTYLFHSIYCAAARTSRTRYVGIVYWLLHEEED